MRILSCLLLGISCFAADLSKPFVRGFEARGDHYVSPGPGYSLTVTPEGAVLGGSGQSIRMQLQGASPKNALEGLDRMPGRANYFRGGEARSYAIYGSVRSRGIYPGIDVVFHGNQERLLDNSPQNGAWSRPASSVTSAYRGPRPALCGLEYDFEAAPGSDVARIRVGFDGADEVRIDASGELVVKAGGLTVRQPVPVAYQMMDGRQRRVSVAYRMDGSNRVRFAIGPYDRGKALVIDPQLVFETLFGGSGTSGASDVALDAAGNIYVAGETESANFPAVNAEQAQPGAAPLLESANGRQTWTTPAIGAAIVRSIASSPAAPATIYASIVSGVVKSTDGGTTWTTLANAGLTTAVVSIAVDAGSATTVYAVGASGGVFTSTNGGTSWTASTNGLFVPNSLPTNLPQFTGVFANPATPGMVFAVASGPDFVYRSTDFGQTWTQANIPLGASPQSIVFSPVNEYTMIVGQSNGPLYKSMDGGVTWNQLSSGETVRGTEGLAIQPGNALVLLGAGSNALSRSSDGGLTWTSVLAQPDASVEFDPRNPNTAYALSSAGLFRSGDGGQTWTQTALPYTENLNTLFVSAADSRVLVGEGTETDAFVTKYSADGSTILYSTYLGGTANDGATGIAVDASGSAYVTGVTLSSNFPATSGAFEAQFQGMTTVTTFAQDAFITKLSPDGSQLVYSTFLGGGAEQSGRIAVDGAGEAVVTGSTTSSNFPVTAGAYQTALNTNCNNPQIPIGVQSKGGAFVTKLSATGGSLVFSTLLGGSCAAGGQPVTLDGSGNIWVGGSTTAPDFPVTSDALQPASGGGYYDGFLARFTPAGSLAYATYIGGPGFDTVAGIAFDKSGKVYLTGTSAGLSEAASPGAFETKAGGSCFTLSIGPEIYEAVGSAFVLKLDAAAHSNLGLTYLGSPYCLFPSDIAVDAQGEPWIGGKFSPAGSAPQTASPLRIGIGSGFLSKFSADFTQLLFSTYFDTVNGLTLDSGGLAVAVGAGPANNQLGTQQAFVAKVNPAATAVELDSVQNALTTTSPSIGIAPGEYVRLLGKNMGPATPAMGIIKNGVVTASDAGVVVTFDGTAVPLLMVSAAEIDLVAPFELAGKTSTTVQVAYQGSTSNAVQVLAVPSALQLLGIFNEDFTVNSASNPAAPASIMSLYVAGVGQTNPPSADGQVNGFPLLAAPGPVTIIYNGNNPPISDVSQTVTYAGSAPGLAAGIFQINFVAPQAGMTPLNLSVGGPTVGLSLAVQ